MNFSKINELKPYDLNCNIFDVYSYNGLSMQELLCQFFTKINECINTSNETIDLAEWLVSEGLKQEVAIKLSNWLNDGTLENLINETLFENLNNKIDNVSSQLAHIENKTFTKSVNIKDFGAHCDGKHDDTQAFLDMIEYGQKNSIHNFLVSGTINIDLDEKIELLAPMKLIGSNQTGARFRFTSKNGGFKFGDDSTETNELHFYNITLDGTRTANTVLEIQRIMNIYFHNLRVGGTLDYAIKIYNNAGIIFWNEGGIDGNMYTTLNTTTDHTNWRLKQKGILISDINSLVIRNTNMWTLKNILDIEGYCTHLLFDSNWVEMCENVFTFNTGLGSNHKNMNITSRDNIYMQSKWSNVGYDFSLFKVLSGDLSSGTNSINEGLFVTQNDRILFNSGLNFYKNTPIYLEKYNGNINFSIQNISICMFAGAQLSSDFVYIRASDALLSSSNAKFNVNVLDFSTTSTTRQGECISNIDIENILEQGRANFGAVTTKRLKLTKNNPNDYTGAIYYADFNKSMRMFRTSADITELVNVRKGTASPTGSIAPDFIGQIYIDTNLSKAYIAVNMGNTNWKEITV